MIRLVGILRRILEGLVAAILLMLVLVTFADVIGRYWFGQPLPGGHVLVQCLVCLLVFTGMPIVVLDDEHLRVRLLDERMTPQWRFWRDTATDAMIVACLAVLGGQMYWQAGYFADNGEYFESIRIPLSWMAWYAAVATTFATAFAIRRLTAKRGGTGDHA